MINQKIEFLEYKYFNKFEEYATYLIELFSKYSFAELLYIRHHFNDICKPNYEYEYICHRAYRRSALDFVIEKKTKEIDLHNYHLNESGMYKISEPQPPKYEKN